MDVARHHPSPSSCASARQTSLSSSLSTYVISQHGRLRDRDGVADATKRAWESGGECHSARQHRLESVGVEDSNATSSPLDRTEAF